MSGTTLTNTSLRQTKPRLKRTPRVHLPFFIPISLLSITRTSLSHKEVTVHVPQMVLYLKAKNYWEGFLTLACYNLIHNTGKLFSFV